MRSGELLRRYVVWIGGLDGEDLVGSDGDGDGVAGEVEGGAFGFFHQVGFGGGGGSGWDVEFDLSCFAGPLVHAEDEGVGVFGFFDCCEGDVGVFDAGPGVFGGEGAGVGAVVSRCEESSVIANFQPRDWSTRFKVSPNNSHPNCEVIKAILTFGIFRCQRCFSPSDGKKLKSD